MVVLLLSWPLAGSQNGAKFSRRFSRPSFLVSVLIIISSNTHHHQTPPNINPQINASSSSLTFSNLIIS
ncbi:hypothetical protein PRUPE_1G339500 [Prunus persica]|uniref:Uncharacterized protein n=1 Tax=Prunus persica TaxID=3760 RepID=M5Y289_PRUPE|nr:hypothetical protein PRUPE_1G339500 [Prunus persica]